MVRPTVTATMVQIRPGRMNEWFRTNFPIFVVPDKSKAIVATSAPEVGMKNRPFTAGYIPIKEAGPSPRAKPSGITARTVAA